MNTMALVCQLIPLLFLPVGFGLILAELLDHPYGPWLIAIVGLEFGLLLYDVPNEELLSLSFSETSKLLAACTFGGTATGFFFITRILKRKGEEAKCGEVDESSETVEATAQE